MIEEMFQPISTPRGSDLIIEEIWGLIKRGELKPGDKLPPERELMKKFGVSKAVLREALNTLEAYGHITKKRGAQGGSIILELTPDIGVSLIKDYVKSRNPNKGDIADVMKFLHVKLLWAAVERMDDDGRNRIEKLIERLERDYREHGGSRCGWEFPILLAEISGNPILLAFEQVVMSLLLDLELSDGIGDLGGTELERKYNELAFKITKETAEAVLKGDAELASSIMSKYGSMMDKLL